MKQIILSAFLIICSDVLTYQCWEFAGTVKLPDRPFGWISDANGSCSIWLVNPSLCRRQGIANNTHSERTNDAILIQQLYEHFHQVSSNKNRLWWKSNGKCGSVLWIPFALTTQMNSFNWPDAGSGSKLQNESIALNGKRTDPMKTTMGWLNYWCNLNGHHSIIFHNINSVFSDQLATVLLWIHHW
jgi:hypothetical protein